MRLLLRVLAVVFLLGGAIIWFATGSHPGWSRTKVQVIEKDPVTELEARRWEDRFVAGVDFLGACALGGAALFGLSFLFGRRPSPRS